MVLPWQPRGELAQAVGARLWSRLRWARGSAT